jgi:hypothetical protein
MPISTVRRLPLLALMAVAGLAAGCAGSGGGETVAFRRPAAPAVDASRLPLSTPPVYWIRPGTEDPARASRAVVAPSPPPVRSGEEAILRAAGAADPTIREQLARAPGVAVLPDRALERLLASGTGAVPGAEPARRRGATPVGN